MTRPLRLVVPATLVATALGMSATGCIFTTRDTVYVPGGGHRAHPHGGPPGQTGRHPHGGPPGHTGHHPGRGGGGGRGRGR